MQTLSAAQTIILQGARRSVHVRVKIDRGSSDFVDMTTLEGRDWIKSVTLTQHIDQPVQSAQVKLHREVFDLSLATLMTNSKLNADGIIVDIGNPIVIETATLGMDQLPVEADWVERFRGEIDKLGWGGEVMTLNCRDEGGTLQDSYVEDETTYPAAATADDVEDIMQEILDDWAAGVILFFPDGTGGTPLPQGGGTDPGWAINQYIQQKAPVMEILRGLAAQIGWDVRYKFQTSTLAHELQFFEPDRAKSTPDFTFGPDRYFEITRAALDRSLVRNVIRVTFGLDANNRQTVEVSDSASITKYGRRYMAVAEASSSAIDSLTEATDMADAILADLKDPSMDHEVSMPYFWPLELGDLHRYEANGRHYDSDQDLAAIGFRHDLSKGTGVTRVQTRGKPSAGVLRWLASEQRVSTDLVTPNAINNVNILDGTISVNSMNRSVVSGGTGNIYNGSFAQEDNG